MPKKAQTLKYTAKAAAELFEAMASGETPGAFCRHKKIPHGPFLSWIQKKYPAQFWKARVNLAYFWADEIIEISDDISKDFKVNSKGEKVVDNEAIQRAKLKVDTRKWLLSKIVPKEFGDALELKGHVDANVTTNIPKEIAEMVDEMKMGMKGDKDNGKSPIEN